MKPIPSTPTIGLAAVALLTAAVPAAAQQKSGTPSAKFAPPAKAQLASPAVAYGGSCGVASVVSFNAPSGLNVDDALGVLPAGALPSLGNADFFLSLGENSGACGILPGARATLIVNTAASQGTFLSGYGCAPMTDGELLIPLAGLQFVPSQAWSGPGFPANFQFAVPSDPAMCGMQLFVQGAFIDFVAETGVVLTNRLELTIGLDPNAGPDECAQAQPIGEGLTPGSNLGATTSPVGPQCSSFGPIGADVWYRYTASQTGTVVAGFCAPGAGAGFDTALAAYSGDCGNLVELACNDDSCELLSEIAFQVTAGQDYFLAVGGFGGEQGEFTLSVQNLSPAQNDECAQALSIVEGLTSGSNFGATTSPDGPQCSSFGPSGADVWYEFVPTTSGFLTAGFCDPGAGASFDTLLAVYEGECGNLFELACNDDACGLLSSVANVPVTAGQVYRIAVGGFDGAQGTFDLSVAVSTTVSPDDCADAEPIADGFTSGSTVGFTTSAEAATCLMGNDRWYVYTAPCTGTATVSFCAPGAGADFDTVLGAWLGDCGSLVPLACNDDSCGLLSQISFPVVAGTDYYLQVGGFAGIFGTEQGSYTLGVLCQ